MHACRSTLEDPTDAAARGRRLGIASAVGFAVGGVATGIALGFLFAGHEGGAPPSAALPTGLVLRGVL